jgi:hypothetical protein
MFSMNKRSHPGPSTGNYNLSELLLSHTLNLSLRAAAFGLRRRGNPRFGQKVATLAGERSLATTWLSSNLLEMDLKKSACFPDGLQLQYLTKPLLPAPAMTGVV